MNSRDHWGIALILATFITLGLAYSLANPLHEATDEVRHYRFVRHIVQAGSLPVQGQEDCLIQSHHPPLYYLLGAAATVWIDTGRDVCFQPPINPFWNYRYWEVGVDNKNQYLHGPAERFPWPAERRAALLMRAVNVLLGALTVWLTWAIGRALWPKRPYLALGGAAFVAFNPMFVYLSGAVNNDIVAAAAGGALLLASVRLLRDDADLTWRWGLLFGLLYALALMSKFNLAAMGLVVATAVTYVAWQKQQWRQWLQVGLTAAAVTLLLAGWWFVRNQLLYGELTGFETMTAIWGGRDPSQSFWLAVSEIPYAWTSLWGRFGYGQLPLPEAVYSGLRWFTRLALLGLFVPLLRGRQWRVEWRQTGLALALLPLAVLIYAWVLFSYMMVSTAGPMGRFFFPALPAFGLLIFYGLSQWLNFLQSSYAELRGGHAEVHGEKRRKESLRTTQYAIRTTPDFWAAVGVNIIMALLTLVALVGYLMPAYAQPPGFEDTAVSPAPVAQFDAFVVLRDYEVSTTSLAPGQPLDLDLYWEVLARPPGDFYFFIHLIDQFGNIIAQRDTHPGLGRFPSSQWQPGDRFVESIRLYLPETAYVPAEASLNIGFYAPGAGYRLGVSGPDGSGLGDALALATILVEPRTDLAANLPNPQTWRFDNGAELVGYEYNNRRFRPDDVLAVDLYWQSVAADFAGDRIWLRLVDNTGHQRAFAEATFAQATFAQSLPADSGMVTLAMVVPPDLTPGSHRLELYLLDHVTNRPRDLVADDGRLINNYIDLAPVSVIGER
jgi:4-amino-4-deoxy-L-arabinose transferase-like glycosyltransferase